MSEAAVYKVNLEHVVPQSKEGSGLMRSGQKDTEANLKRHSQAKFGEIQTTKIITTVIDNILSKNS